MEMTTMNKEKLISAVKQIPAIAKENGWVVTLDRDEGSLFYSPKQIPSGADLFQVTDEYALYVDKKNIPQGVMVEYFEYNFIKHHEAFESLTETLFNSPKDMQVASEASNKKGTLTIFKELLEKTLIVEAMDESLCPAK